MPQGIFIKKFRILVKGFLAKLSGAFSIGAIVHYQHIVPLINKIRGDFTPTRQISRIAVKIKNQPFGYIGLEMQCVQSGTVIGSKKNFLKIFIEYILKIFRKLRR